MKAAAKRHAAGSAIALLVVTGLCLVLDLELAVALPLAAAGYVVLFLLELAGRALFAWRRRRVEEWRTRIMVGAVRLLADEEKERRDRDARALIEPRVYHRDERGFLSHELN